MPYTAKDFKIIAKSKELKKPEFLREFIYYLHGIDDNTPLNSFEDVHKRNIDDEITPSYYNGFQELFQELLEELRQRERERESKIKQNL